VVILQLDEPGLWIYPDADAAAQDIEAIDIEGSLRFAYDDSGYKLEVEWLERNHRSKVGPITGVLSGRYRLVRSSIREPLVLADLISAAPYFEPSEQTSEMLALADELRQRYPSC